MYTIPFQIAVKELEPATGLPFSVSDAKEHLRVDGSEEDGYIELLIKAAWSIAENYTQRPLLQRQFEQQFDEWPGYQVVLYWGNVASVDEIILAKEGGPEELDPADYKVDLIMDRARIVVTDIPTTVDGPGAVTITYTAGYTTIPPDLIAAMKLIVGELYERRENHVKQLPTAVEHILNMYRLWQI